MSRTYPCLVDPVLPTPKLSSLFFEPQDLPEPHRRPRSFTRLRISKKKEKWTSERLRSLIWATKKRAPWLFRVYRGWNSTQLYRDYNFLHYKDPYESTRIQWKVGPGFFRGSYGEVPLSFRLVFKVGVWWVCDVWFFWSKLCACCVFFGWQGKKHNETSQGMSTPLPPPHNKKKTANFKRMRVFGWFVVDP